MVERKKKDHLPIYGIGPALCYPMVMLSAVGIWLSVKGIIPMKIENKPIKGGSMFEIKDCEDYEVAKNLIREYSEIKGAESCFVSLDRELADLDTYYKDGALLVGFENENPIATIAIKRIDKDTCEAKRLYIKPDYRGKGYARVLMNEMLDRSRKLGFKEVTFTTKPEMMSIGYGLYKRMGFEEMNCIDGVASMRMIL